jgi:hypothetical protein
MGNEALFAGPLATTLRLRFNAWASRGDKAHAIQNFVGLVLRRADRILGHRLCCSDAVGRSRRTSCDAVQQQPPFGRWFFLTLIALSSTGASSRGELQTTRVRLR